MARREIPITVDFETHRIVDRPDYPPEPVGVSVLIPGRKARYYAWGHHTENNCTKAEAARVLREVWRDNRPKLFHNGKFDIEVAHVHFGLPRLSHTQLHDTMFLAFLDNPHNTKLSLKPLSELYLAMPPDEQDELHEWIQSHVFTSLSGGEGSVVVVSKKPKGFFKIPTSQVGGFIAYAPGKLTGRYANGDTVRTRKLFDLLYPRVMERGMSEAYDRERRLVPIFLENEAEGIRVDHPRLHQDVGLWEQGVERSEQWVRRRLGVPELNIDKGNELADALEGAGAVSEWILTASGARSTSKENLLEVIDDGELVNVLNYRSTVINILRNFGWKWDRMASNTGGLIHTSWNQVRQSGSGGKGTKGARTGRLSTNPNLQNLPKRPPILVWTNQQEKAAIGDGVDYLRVPRAFKDYPLPNIRDYIVPDRRGHVLLNRDYSQQELRALAHYEDGVLLAAYNENPFLDIHDHAQKLINEMLQANYPRKPIKNMGFGLIYGMGAWLLAKMSNTDEETAKVLKQAYLDIFPGLRDLVNDLSQRGRSNEPIRTWGGREYYVEPPSYVGGKLRTWEYKLLNVLIQGSSADCTKQAIINYDSIKRDGRFLLTVHDEIMVDAPTQAKDAEMNLLREAMEGVEFDVPMLSDGKWSDYSWGALQKYTDRRAA